MKLFLQFEPIPVYKVLKKVAKPFPSNVSSKVMWVSRGPSFFFLIFLLFFFASPKKNQKKSSEIDVQPDFGSSFTGHFYYCGFGINKSVPYFLKADLVTLVGLEFIIIEYLEILILIILIHETQKKIPPQCGQDLKIIS